MRLYRKSTKEKREKKDELEVKLRKGIWRTGKVQQEEFNFFQAIGLQPTNQDLTDGVYQPQPAPYNSFQEVEQWLTDEPDNSKTSIGKGWSGIEDIKTTAHKDCLCDRNARFCYWNRADHGGTRQNPQFKDCHPYQTCNCSNIFTGCSFWKHKPTDEFTRLNDLNIKRLARIRLAEKAKQPLKKIVLLKTKNQQESAVQYQIKQEATSQNLFSIDSYTYTNTGNTYTETETVPVTEKDRDELF